MTEAQKETRRKNLAKAAKARIANIEPSFWPRFWKRVKRTSSDWSSCWLWTGTLNGSGYGQVRRLGKAPLCHRLMFEVTFGPIPKGMCVLHHCDTPACVNPKHLFLGTPQDNVDDCIKKNRRRYRHGDNHHNAKLTDAQVADIKKLAASMSPIGRNRILGKKFGVHFGHINNIIGGFRRSSVKP